MSKARQLADLLDASGDVSVDALDNVPPSNDASALTTGTLPVDRVPYVGRRNLIINGAMQVSQRGDFTTATSTSANQYTIDRFSSWHEAAAITVTTQHTNVTLPDGTSSKALRMQATSSGTGYFGIMQIVEGYELLSNRTITLSCWVRTNRDNVRFRHSSTGDYPNTVPATGEWTYLTQTATLGTLVGNGAGGSETGFMLLCYNNTNVSVSSGDYIEFTQLQLELGSVATPFEHRSYGEELALCQRYYFRWVAESGSDTFVSVGMRYSNGNGYGVFHLPTTMRAIPSCSAPNSFQELYPSTAVTKSLSVVGKSKNTLRCLWSSSASTGQATTIRGLNTNSYFDADAEL